MCCRRLHCIDSSVTAAEPLRHDVVIAVVCGSLHALQAPSSAMALYDHCSQEICIRLTAVDCIAVMAVSLMQDPASICQYQACCVQCHCSRS